MNDRGTQVEILVNDQIRLTEYRCSDKCALVEYLNDKDIYDLTLRIPYPYTEAHAEEWLALYVKNTEQQGRPVNWAIRNADDRLIGGLSFTDFEAGKSHRAELGYWLAKPFWGRGIMTEVVRRLCLHAFEELGLIKISRPCVHRKHGLCSCAGKMQLQTGGRLAKAPSQGRQISRRQAICVVEIIK